MSKVSRGMKISLIFILNPHRIFWLQQYGCHILFIG